jgi:hypothetical protein
MTVTASAAVAMPEADVREVAAPPAVVERGTPPPLPAPIASFVF